MENLSRIPPSHITQLSLDRESRLIEEPHGINKYQIIYQQ